MAILTGPEIRAQVFTKRISVDPYIPENVQQNSLDVTLGKEVCVYSDVVDLDIKDSYLRGAFSYEVSQHLIHRDGGAQLCVKAQNSTKSFEMDASGWLVKPGILYLMHVEEVLHAPELVMTLDGRSSLARLGLIIHFTAGHAETGFHGQYTMEVSAMHPLRIYPGMRIAQVIFNTVEGKIEDYKARGNYVGAAAMGAQPSRSWKQFK